MRIFRYLTKEILLTGLAVLLIFLLVFISTQLAIYLNKMAAGDLDSQVFLQLLGIITATLVGMLLPMSFFIAILLTYGRLYADSEMTALFACGMSRRRLVSYTLIMAAVITVIVAYLSLVAAPRMTAYQNSLLAQNADQNIVRAIVPGRFQQTDDGRKIFYVEGISRDHKNLQNIFIAERNVQTNPLQANKPRPPDAEDKVWDIIVAKSGAQVADAERDGNFLVVNQGDRYVGAAGEKNFLLIQYGAYGIRLPDIQAPLQDLSDPRNASTWQLLRNYYKSPKIAAELQWRISIPLQTFILALLAVPLSRTIPRQGRYAPLLPAIFIYLIYANALFVARDWIEKGWINVNIGMWWIHLLLLLLTLYLYVGKPGWDPREKFAHLRNTN